MITVNTIAEDGFVVIVDSDSIERFRDLIQRGVNLFPDAHPEIKEFADVITNGHILQDYYGQDTSPTKK